MIELNSRKVNLSTKCLTLKYFRSAWVRQRLTITRSRHTTTFGRVLTYGKLANLASNSHCHMCLVYSNEALFLEYNRGWFRDNIVFTVALCQVLVGKSAFSAQHVLLTCLLLLFAVAAAHWLSHMLTAHPQLKYTHLCSTIRMPQVHANPSTRPCNTFWNSLFMNPKSNWDQLSLKSALRAKRVTSIDSALTIHASCQELTAPPAALLVNIPKSSLKSPRTATNIIRNGRKGVPVSP